MAARTPHRDLEKQKYWLNKIEQWRASGSSKMEFCRQQGVSIEQFYYWHRELRKRKLVKDELGNPAERQKNKHLAKFVPVEIKPVLETSGKTFVERLEIVTPGGYIVRIP